MKNFLVIIVSLVYFTSVTGATVHVHYCMGRLANWGLGQDTSKTCGKCGMEKEETKNNGCCKDEQKFFKNTVDQKTAAAAFHITIPFSPALPCQVAETTIPYFNSFAAGIHFSHAPPRSNGVSLHIRNCVHRI